MGSSLTQRPFWGSFFIRVPFYIGDRKRNPNLENYPFRVWGFGYNRAYSQVDGGDSADSDDEF